MDLYTGKIDEFVDWVTGEDTSQQEKTNDPRVSSTGGLQVSGGSIRELLQSKLKTPFVYYEDTVAGLYRLFSSETTKDKWIRMNTEGSSDYNPEESTKLELFNFVRPSDTIMTFNGLDPNPKYIINGDSESSAAKLAFNVNLAKEQGGGIVYESDSFTVTYKIIDSNGVEHTQAEEKDSTFLNGTKKVTKNIYSLLTVGQNTVTVTMKARNSSAQNSITFPVYLVEFELSSNFDFAAHWDPNQPIDVPISIKRSNTNLTLKVDIFIDGYQAKLASGMAAATWIVNNTETNPTNRFAIKNEYAANVTSSDHIKHNLKIVAQMYDQDASTVYYSNVLFFDFVVASDTAGIVNRFVTTGYSTPYTKMSTDMQTGQVIFQAVQFEPFTLPWAYYTDRESTQQTLDINWAIRTGQAGSYQYSQITTGEGLNKQQSETLRFIPDFYNVDTNGTSLNDVYLVAMYEGNEIDAFPINVTQSTLSISETGGYNLRLQAYGKTNQSPDKDQWVDSLNGVTTTFTNVVFDNNSGWDNNSFVTSGINSKATINYTPIPSQYNLSRLGKTIEVDFKSENVVNEDDTIICIGDPTGGHIRITTNEAGIYNGNNHVVHTNYKANERVKLAFVFNPVQSGNPDSNLAFIINNGILERAAGYGTASNYTSDLGNIVIGGAMSGVRVYNIRAYDKALTAEEALSNYIYDSSNKAEIVSRNNILDAGEVKYDLVKNKIDTFVITGNITPLLTQASGKKDSETTASFKRECISDPSKTFEVVNGMIRKHGQSTLNYPITSMKIWTNKAKEDGVVPVINLSDTQKAEGLNKNRYIMKTGSIPANKFVLQANYADSSGTHNGGLLRLIQDTWYNASVGNQYVLRTAPQLFTSGYTVTHNDATINEDGWTEGYGTGKAAGMTWPDIAGKPFPYTIRTAPDSFPCAVFYKNGANDEYHFLGQYVFMDDKKSDYTYGERSIYHFGNGNDPFVLKTENTKNGPLGKQDTDANRVWDNNNVLRIEVVLPNTTLTSYMDFDVTDTNGAVHACTDVKYKANGDPDQYYWEDYFEMIFPDEDDLAEDDAKDGLTKFDANSRFARKAQPFVNFLKWITDCKKNYNKTTDWWSAGTYSSTLDAFKATAAQHLDLYKLAAYYIFLLRFGLVDSVERNAQLKTYDGQHWHYEPWDMDIALGNTNQGALVLNPPLTRQSFEPGTTTYAFSGKSATTSNVLWDCLEGWDEWANVIVPNVAQALYEAGLTYDNIIKMFDEEYAEKWSETMYNESGHFKYIENGGSDWLAWLQGSRTSHRHWWISTSMNYYDAKWSCGSFNEHRVRLFADKAINQVGTDIITIKPTSNTFFKIAQQEGKTSLGTIEADRNNPATFDVSTAAFSAKDPSYIYGGTFIEEIDLSCMAEKLKAVDFSLCYDSVLGAPIKKLNIGLPYTVNSSTQYTGKVSGTQLRLTGYDSITQTDAFENLAILDITGQSTITNTQELLQTRNRKNITDFYAIGTGITEFSSSTSGNKFNTIKLPGVTTVTHAVGDPSITAFTTLTMTNSSWNNIEFWNTVKSDTVAYELDENDEVITDSDGNPVIKANAATFTKTSIPYQLRVVQFKGSTASNECAGQFVLDWIDSIEQNLAAQNPSYTEEDLYAVLRTKTLEAENINWGLPEQTLRITYKDLARIAQFNNGNNGSGLIKGYIMLSDAQEMSAIQLNNLVQWFGSSVFTKSSKNSNLVVDQNLPYTRITFTGTKIINGQICLREGNRATVRATKFTLSETDDTNYEWQLTATNPNNNVQQTSSESVLSVQLYRGDDGIQYIIANESGIYADSNGGYDLTVKVFIGGVAQTQTIRIIAASLPDTMDVLCAPVGTSNARKFYINQNIAPAGSLFSGKTDRDTWVMFEQNQQVEFYPQFSQTPGSGNYADLQSVSFSINRGASIQQQDLQGQEDLSSTRVSIDSPYAYYNRSATRGGIRIILEQAPQDMRLVELEVNAVIGDRRYTKVINIVLYDDAVSLHNASISQGVQGAITDRFNAIYGSNTAPLNFFKSDLYSLYGDLDFSGYASSVGTVFASNGEPLIKYLPNITGLIFTGCSNVTPTGASFGTYNSQNHTLLFLAMPKLTTLSFQGCNSQDTDVLDLTNCPNITALNLSGTQVGVKLVNSNITQLALGSPTTVIIDTPTAITSDNVTIQSSQNLSNITLANVNNAATYGYRMFNVIYNPS